MSCRREAVGGRRVVEKVLGMVWSKGRNSGRHLSSLILLAFYFFICPRNYSLNYTTTIPTPSHCPWRA